MTPKTAARSLRNPKVANGDFRFASVGSMVVGHLLIVGVAARWGNTRALLTPLARNNSKYESNQKS